MVIFHGAEVHLKVENRHLLMGDDSITKIKMPSILVKILVFLRSGNY